MRRDFVPAADDLLCERCGYVLNGLPPDGACPECGLAVAESTVASPRRPPLWETGLDRGPARFQRTALAVLRSPRRFFRNMTSQGDTVRSARFGFLAILPALVFTTKAVLMHSVIMHLVVSWPGTAALPLLMVAVPVGVGCAWVGFYLAVVRLTTLESRYWGMRLPRDVVRRALHYDAPHASAASLLPWAVTLVYLCLLIANESYSRWLTTYLYTLSAAVVAAATYLFAVYATSMKSLMYANR